MQNIPLNGLNYITPNSDTPDGDTLTLVNLRKKNQSLQIVTRGTSIATLSQEYDIVYIHSNNYIENWLGTKGGILYSLIKTSPIQICHINSPIKQIQSIGNTLSLISDSGIFYLLFINNEYKTLGFKPPFPYCKLQYTLKDRTTAFTEIGGTITDIQKAMEAIIVKNRWKEENAFLLCGAYCVRYALRLFDNSYILHSPPILLYPYSHHPYYVILSYQGDTFVPDNSNATAQLYSVNAEFDLSILKHWSDIIMSVDIFISNELGVISEEFRKIEDAIEEIKPPDKRHPQSRKHIAPQQLDKAKIIEQISNINNFYHICSIPINSDKITISFPEKSIISTLQNIVHQSVLPVDNFSHHIITASSSYVYNQRLHIANIQTIFPKGLDFRAFVPEKKVLGGRRTNTSSSDSNDPTRPDPSDTDNELNIERVYIQIFIHASEDVYVFNKVEDINYIKMNPFFSYPDTRAYKAVITTTDKLDNIIQQTSFSLKPHPNLNISYYIDPSLYKITLLDVSISSAILYEDVYCKINEENKIKVSALQNPFVFPNENTYVTGKGEVIGMATNSSTVSEGQFGQYPLYVFTNEGIYLFAVGSENNVYSNIVPVSEEIALPGTIKPVTGAVFFITARGAFIISGSTPTPLSTVLNANCLEQNMQYYDQILQTLLPDNDIHIFSFFEFIHLPDITIHFNYIENEIIIASMIARHTYVYNFNSASWHTSTYVFTTVQNCYPNLYGIENNEILNISEETNSFSPIILVTRPIKYGTQQFKSLYRHILRGYINNPITLGLFNFSSNDAINFRLITNQRIHKGKYRDLDTGLLSLNKYRYFALILIGFLIKDSRIDFITSSVYPVYKNDKNR